MCYFVYCYRFVCWSCIKQRSVNRMFFFFHLFCNCMTFQFAEYKTEHCELSRRREDDDNRTKIYTKLPWTWCCAFANQLTRTLFWKKTKKKNACECDILTEIFDGDCVPTQTIVCVCVRTNNSLENTKKTKGEMCDCNHLVCISQKGERNNSCLSRNERIRVKTVAVFLIIIYGDSMFVLL